MNSLRFRRGVILTALCAAALIFGNAGRVVADHHESPFASQVIDIGVVVRDVAKSVKFYKEAIGFKESGGFQVPADFAKNVGLSDGQPLDVKVLTLGDGNPVTKLKLMSFPGVKSKQSDNRFIHTQLGFSYLTIVVKDTNAALKRLDNAGIKPIARGTQELPAPLPQGVYLTIVRDPDGNLIELVGPKL